MDGHIHHLRVIALAREVPEPQAGDGGRLRKIDKLIAHDIFLAQGTNRNGLCLVFVDRESPR
jgi:hypothetical protein